MAGGAAIWPPPPRAPRTPARQSFPMQVLIAPFSKTSSGRSAAPNGPVATVAKDAEASSSSRRSIGRLGQANPSSFPDPHQHNWIERSDQFVGSGPDLTSERSNDKYLPEIGMTRRRAQIEELNPAEG